MKLHAGQGDHRHPAREGESHLDYIDRLAHALGFMRNGQPKRPVLEMPADVRMPYRERVPGEDDGDERSPDGPWSDR